MIRDLALTEPGGDQSAFHRVRMLGLPAFHVLEPTPVIRGVI